MKKLPKTLYVILTHNEKHLSTQYYESLKYYQEQDNFDLIFLDNGSSQRYRPNQATHRFPKNVYFNGAIAWAWKKMLENDEYEYLVFSNNDVSLHGYRFVETMVRQMQKENFVMFSPSIIELNGQNFWPIMHCWYKDKPRETKWIDFICPFIHRKVVEKIEWPTWWRSPSYGFDDYAALICGRENWKVGVSDSCTMFHYGSHSYRQERADDGLDIVTMQHTHRKNFDWNFEQMGLYDEMKELANHKALYGRHNSLKMGAMPSTPDEGYYTGKGSTWFRNKEEEKIHKKREEIFNKNYLKSKGIQ